VDEGVSSNSQLKLYAALWNSHAKPEEMVFYMCGEFLDISLIHALKSWLI